MKFIQNNNYTYFFIICVPIVTIIIICSLIKYYKRKNKKILISIEGNIGVGKTTFLNMLKNSDYFKKNSIFVEEPIDDWINLKDEHDKNLLKKFYDDKERWSYTFQNCAYITRMYKMTDALNKNKKFIFLDRSIKTDKNVFAKMLRDDSTEEHMYIDKCEWDTYNLWNDFFEKFILGDTKQIIIYLYCEPEIAHNRILKRNRIEENTIPQEYLKKLHYYHENWIKKEKNILKLNCNIDFENNKKISDDIFKKVKKFINSKL